MSSMSNPLARTSAAGPHWLETAGALFAFLAIGMLAVFVAPHLVPDRPVTLQPAQLSDLVILSVVGAAGVGCLLTLALTAVGIRLRR